MTRSSTGDSYLKHGKKILSKFLVTRRIIPIRVETIIMTIRHRMLRLSKCWRYRKHWQRVCLISLDEYILNDERKMQIYPDCGPLLSYEYGTRGLEKISAGRSMLME